MMTSKSRSFFYCFMAAIFSLSCAGLSSAQIRIEIPRIKRPKVETRQAEAPRPETTNVPTASGTTTTTTTAAGKSNAATPQVDKAQEEKEKQLRHAFYNEINDYFHSVRRVAALHDPKYHDNTASWPGAEQPQEWVKIQQDLAAIDNLCRTKYTTVRDWPDYSHSLQMQGATVCRIAARGAELEKLGKADLIRREFRSLTESLVMKDVEAAFTDKDGYVSAKVMKMLFERDAWKQSMRATWGPKFAKAGVEMSEEMFVPFEKRFDELLAHIDKTAPSHKWEQPSYNDVAAQSLVKGRIASEVKGAQILRIGTSYNGWREHEGWSETSRMGNTRFLKKYRTRYKRGWVLLKVPNRPHCQSREWLIKQEAPGNGAFGPVKYEGLGSAIFMPCN